MKCPHRNELIQLNGDDLPSDRSESLFDHLEACEPCATAFEQLAESTNNLGEHLAGIHQKDIQKAREKIAKRPGIQEPVASPKTDSGESQYALSPGQKLEKYEIIRLLDTGGMGEVYEARHGLMGHHVAIKVIRGRHQDNPVAYQKFLTEMKTLVRVEHPNLVRALDGGDEDGCLFVVMELLGGESLHTLCVERRIRSVIEIIDAMLGLCRGLGKLHAHQLLHRDVKPANIMRLKDGTIKVIDLGLAADNVAGRQMSHVGAGTQGYMPPEQQYGDESLNERSDIFSAGRVLKDLLRALPRSDANSNQTNAVSRLEKLAEWMTKLEMENRPQSVKEVLVELKKLRRAMGNSRKRLATATQAAKPQAQPKRRGVIWLVLAALLIGIIGFGAFQIIFKTDRRATVLVENHQPGDVIQITSDDGKVRSVELGDEPKFVVDRGTYELSLEGPDNRRLNPANITVTGLDQLTVRVEDRPTETTANSPTNSGQSTRKPFELEMVSVAERTNSDRTEPMSGRVANTAPTTTNPAESKTNPTELSAPFSTTDIRTSRKAWSESWGLPETLTVGMPSNSAFQLEFVLIPPGTFDMGMPASLPLMPGNKREWAQSSQPAHRVTITQPFYFSCYEVTQKQFRDVMGGGLTPFTGDGTKFPATQIPWKDCVGFCSRMTQSGTNIPTGGKMRLPNEAEWEYACRAGTTSRFWIGDQIGPSQASLRINGRKMTLEPVGAFQPNPFGLYQMHGNVSEWCSDWFSPDSYASSDNKDPRGPSNGSRKVIRGGGYSNPPFSATSYWRQSYEPATRSGNIGLRPVIELSIHHPIKR